MTTPSHDLAKLTRNSAKVKSNLYIKDNVIYTKEACTIEFPSRFVDKNLCEIGIECTLISYYALIMGGDYAVANALSLIKTSPIKMETVTRGDVDYIQFHYGPNMAIVNNTKVIRKDVTMYFIFDEFMMNGKIPWYLTYDDFGKVFDLSLKYGATAAADNQQITELIVSYLTRQDNDRKEYFRTNLTAKYKYVPLDSVYYSAPNTVNKLAGNFFTDGITSAITQPTKNSSKVEDLIRA